MFDEVVVLYLETVHDLAHDFRRLVFRHEILVVQNSCEARLDRRRDQAKVMSIQLFRGSIRYDRCDRLDERTKC